MYKRFLVSQFNDFKTLAVDRWVSLHVNKS